MAPSSSSNGQPLSSHAAFLAMLGISFVTMLVALDQTVVATALPDIVTELHGFYLYAWVTTAYLLTSVITVPIFASLGDFFGRRPFLIVSSVLFVASSVLCGVSQTMEMLVFSRGIQGIAGGMLVGTAFASVADLFPDVRIRLKWQMMISLTFGISNVIGPSLGGFITEAWGWRWIFLVNLPIGLFALYFVWRYLPHIKQVNTSEKFHMDWGGLVSITVALGALQLGVEMMPKNGLSLSVIAMLFVSVVGFATLIQFEKRAQQPIVPLDMMRHPILVRLFIFSVILGFVVFALLMYLPLLFQGGMHLTPHQSGLLITPLVVCITVASMTNNKIVTRLPNPNMMLYMGFSLVAVCCIGVMLLEKNTSHTLIALLMVVGGLGIGFVMPNLTIFTQQTSPKAYLGISTGMIQSLRMVGGMLGTAMCGVLVSSIYESQVTSLLDKQHAMDWHPVFVNPEILMNQSEQQTVLAQMQKVALDGEMVLESARTVLIQSVHSGIGLALIVTLIGLVMVKFIPKMQLINNRK